MKGRGVEIIDAPEPERFDGTTTYGSKFQPVQPEPVYQRPRAEYVPNPAKQDGRSAYQENFGAKELPRVEPYHPPRAVPNDAKFEGQSAYNAQFQPYKPEPVYQRPRAQYHPNPAKLDGRSEAQDRYRGYQLPARRVNVGIQQGANSFYVMIPAEAPLPAVSSHVFTTTHDGQTEVCIALMAGMSPYAHNNDIIGTVDLVGIPPARKGTNKFEVTLRQEEDRTLHVQARDLDTGLEREWHSGGGHIVVRMEGQETERLAVGDRGLLGN